MNKNIFSRSLKKTSWAWMVSKTPWLLPSCTSLTHDDLLINVEQQNTGLMTSLTRPAMGVERLLTLLMIPGFNLLIRLQIENKKQNWNTRSIKSIIRIQMGHIQASLNSLWQKQRVEIQRAEIRSYVSETVSPFTWPNKSGSDVIMCYIHAGFWLMVPADKAGEVGSLSETHDQHFYLI